MNTIEESIKQAMFGTRWIVKKRIELFKKELGIGEKLIGLGCSCDQYNNLLLITDKKVLSITKDNFSSNKKIIPIKNIVSFNIKNKLLFCEIEIKSANDFLSVDMIPIKIANELQKIISNLAIC